MKIKIYATSDDGPEIEVKDLFWFEEHGVHDFDGDGFGDHYTFRIEIIGETIVLDGKDDEKKLREMDQVTLSKQIVIVQHSDGKQEKDPNFK